MNVPSRAGCNELVHAQHLHQHLVQAGHVDLQHVQADELWIKLVGSKVWLAMAVPSRLWLGGVISAQRDRHPITALVEQVRASAVTLAILVCVDGLVSYVSAFRKVFRHRVLTGKPGRPLLVSRFAPPTSAAGRSTKVG